MSDTLAIWHPAADETLPPGALAWGSVTRRSTADTALRVCNLSNLYTAHGVSLTLVDTGTTATPSVAAQHLFSLDGEIFTAALDLGDLDPLTITERITVRRVTPSTAQLGTFTFQVLATAESWG